MTCRIDHITVTSPTLQAGSDWVFTRLGVRPQAGGAHPRMGTHNLLLRLGDAMFLEVIAVDPAAPPPSRPRWFDLDRMPPHAAPRLACWVARTDDIARALAGASEALGPAAPMVRGAFEWLISIPEDGALPLGGVAPALIQWQTPGHPATGLQDQGCALQALELVHPQPERVSGVLHSLALAEPGVSLTVVEGPAPALVARLRTPHGLLTVG